MTGQENVVAKKRGRPATGKGKQVVVRLQPLIIEALEAQVDMFSRALPDRVITLPLIVRSKIHADLLDHNWITEEGEPGKHLLKHRADKAGSRKRRKDPEGAN